MTHFTLLPSLFFFFFFVFLLVSQLPLLPALQSSAVAATIPAFPDQQSASSSRTSSSSSSSSACPLHPRDDLLPAVSAACSSSPLHRPRRRSLCCPALAAWLLAAYAPTALSAPPPPTWSRDMPGMPALPEDVEACGPAADRALRTRGVELPRQTENGTCPGGAAACYCGFQLRRLSCGGAAKARRWAPPRAAARRLERDCARAGGLAGCSRCLRVLNQLKSGSNSSNSSRSSKQDCQLMGLTWLLTKKNGSLYLPAATSVLRVLLATDAAAKDPTTCSVASVVGAMPFAVDSAAINGRGVASDGLRPSASSAVQYLVLLLALIMILLSTLSF